MKIENPKLPWYNLMSYCILLHKYVCMIYEDDLSMLLF